MITTSPLKRLRKSLWLREVPEILTVPAMGDEPAAYIPTVDATLDEVAFAEVAISRQATALNTIAYGLSEIVILTDFELLEIDLLNQSPFQWCDVSGDGSSLIASGFDAWAGVFHDGTLWHALGGPKTGAPRKIAIGTKVQVLAEADDFLRSAESSFAAAKSKRWLKEPASTKQINCLSRAGASVSPMNFGLSKYDANCQLRYYWNRHAITSAVFGQAQRSAA